MGFYSQQENLKTNVNHPRLMLFAGHAGTGKSTLAKLALPKIIETTQTPVFILDKDTAYGTFSSQVMKITTGFGNDRDSPFYLENLRDFEYSGLLDIARENLSLGVSVILVGPFTRELQRGLFFDPLSLGMPAQTQIRIAWVELDALEAKRRIIKRGDIRDSWKLDHWEQYLARRVIPPSHENLKIFDNTRFNEADFSTLIMHLTGYPSKI
jgi:predicted kinase